MGDKSVHFPERFDFHPCNTPRGMDYFDINLLTKHQQKRLNNHKAEVVREHQKYLYNNPEVRAVIQIILRKLLADRPSHNIDKYIGGYFATNWRNIIEEVEDYVKKVPKKPSSTEPFRASDKEERRVQIESPEDGSELVSEMSDTSLHGRLIERTVKDMLDKIVDKVDEMAAWYGAEAAAFEEEHRKRSSAISDDSKEKRHTLGKSADEDDEAYFDLGLDFDLDFAAYHEEDDLKEMSTEKYDKMIIETLGKRKPTR